MLAREDVEPQLGQYGARKWAVLSRRWSRSSAEPWIRSSAAWLAATTGGARLFEKR